MSTRAGYLVAADPAPGLIIGDRVDPSARRLARRAVWYRWTVLYRSHAWCWVLDMSETRVQIFDSADAEGQGDAVADVWREGFGPIDDLSEWRETIFDRHRSREAYRLAVASDASGPVGLSWGYIGERGQFWPDRVLDRLGQAAEAWVGGHVEFVELAVIPRARRLGVGRRLHDALLAALPQRHALLGTSSDPADPAVRLYRSRGWSHLGLLEPDAQVMLRLSPQGPRP